MKTVDELLTPITNSGLKLTVSIDTSEFRVYCMSKYGMTNNEWHKKVWRPFMCDDFMNVGPFVWYEKEDKPTNILQEMINDFLDDYPELGGNIRIYFNS